MSQESHAPKPNAGAPNNPASASKALEASQSDTVPLDGTVLRQDRHTTAETQQDTIAIEADSASQAEPNHTPPIAYSLSQDSNPSCKSLVNDEMVGAVLGDYKLLRKLGQGGMGEVYEAYQVSHERIVALKLLARKLSNNTRFVQRLQREARAMAKVDHPNILRCFDFCNENGYAFLTMEFISGANVESWLKALGRFSVGDALHIVLKVAYALQHAHERNLIHRDIKPDNILMTRDGVIKLADLGLAKDTEEDFSLTKTGTSAGTPIYMAPEQARDAKRVDARVDIYALGVMLYVFLTGLPPFTGRTFVELIAAKNEGKFDPIRKHLNEIPRKLDMIVDRMLAIDPNDRFANCGDVITVLEALGLANVTLSFLGMEMPVTPRTRKPIAQASTKLQAPAKACITRPAEEESCDKGVWYLNLVKGHGKVVTMKATTEQVCLLIKTRNLDGEAQISKTEKSGFRDAASFAEFQTFFERRELNAEVNVPSAEVDNQATQLNEQDEEQSESANGVGGILLWVLLFLVVLAVGGYVLYINVIAP